MLESAPVAQLDRANASGALGREFESLRARQNYIPLQSFHFLVRLKLPSPNQQSSSLLCHIARTRWRKKGGIACDAARNGSRASNPTSREARYPFYEFELSMSFSL